MMGTADVMGLVGGEAAKKEASMGAREAVGYGAKVEYRCGLGKEFKGASYGQTDPAVTMECGWDGQWSPTSQLSQCTWVACIEPPIPENSTNLIRNYEGGSVVDFGATGRYSVLS